jgi:hypothetical protein
VSRLLAHFHYSNTVVVSVDESHFSYDDGPNKFWLPKTTLIKSMEQGAELVDKKEQKPSQ